MWTHGAASAAGFEALRIKVRLVWGGVLIAAGTLKTPVKNGYNAQGVNLSIFASIIFIGLTRVNT